MCAPPRSQPRQGGPAAASPEVVLVDERVTHRAGAHGSTTTHSHRQYVVDATPTRRVPCARKMMLLRPLLLALGTEGLLLRGCCAEFVLLEPDNYEKHFAEGFPGPWANGSGVGEINETTFEWAQENVPFFDSSDADLTEAYYFRWKTYHSHMNPTAWPDMPVVVSEFGSAVHWGGPYGAINAAAGHQISEGRWIRDPVPMDSNIRFWLGSLACEGARECRDDNVGHFANGSAGAYANTPYTCWILTGARKRAEVQGAVQFGAYLNGSAVSTERTLADMVAWWEQRTTQIRADCTAGDLSCIDAPPQEKDPAAAPPCYLAKVFTGFASLLSLPVRLLCYVYLSSLRACDLLALFRMAGMRWRGRSPVMAAVQR
jgi:hypothetical protein